MNNKSFVLILTVILAWGISLGGVFSFGLSIGESRGEAAAKDLLERETISCTSSNRSTFVKL